MSPPERRRNAIVSLCFFSDCVGGVISGLRLQGEKAAAQTPNQGGGLYMSLESSIVIELDAPV